MCVHGSLLSSSTVTPFNIVHWQQVMVIKCSFISSPATTKVQNRIKQRRGTLPLLMLRPFENLLAMRRATMLQGRITEQRDVGIWNEVWEPPPPPSISFISTSTPLKCFPCHQILLSGGATPPHPHPPARFHLSCLWCVVCGQLSWSWGQQADMVHLSSESRERNIHSSRGRCAVQWRQLSVR